MFGREKYPWAKIVNKFWILFLAVVVHIHNERPTSWQDSSEGTSAVSPF